MGNQNHSVARKRLSTLAITTTLAAVGVGVVGTGAANAATGSPIAHSADTGTTAVKTVVKATVTADATAKTATLNLAGTTIDAGADFAHAKVSINWGDTAAADTTSVTVDAHSGALSASTANHTYTDVTKDYVVTVTIEDGVNTPALSATANADFVAGAVLNVAVTPATTKKNAPVTLSLAGSSVAKESTAAVTTVNWGDGSKVASFTGDPTKVPALSHTFTADKAYSVVVTLDDGLGNDNSKTTKTVTVTVSDGVVVSRAYGEDRYGTGLAISQHEWANTGVTTDGRQQAKSVVLATGRDFADALVGVPLAKKESGPLLLTDGTQTTVNGDVLKEIKRVLPAKGSTIYILGGEKAMNAGIEAQLNTLGFTTKRLAGEDRFSTALAIATDKSAMADPSHIIVARGDEGENGNGFADALAAGPYAADVFGGGDSAVVLSNDKAFDPATKAYVASKFKTGQKNVAAIGFQAVAAMTTIKGSDGAYAWAAGATRYETAQQVAKAFEDSTKNTAPIGVATGLLYPDALTGGAYMATIDGPLLLTDPAALSPATKGELSDVAATVPSVTIFGGEKAVLPVVANAIAALAKSTITKF
jgi:putative cell wall-binding protein